jgi:CrcB protein
MRISGGVALGALLGAAIRWGSIEFTGAASVGWVLLAVNVAGALLLGRLSAADVSSPVRGLLGPGFCGALTTWSGLAVFLAELTRDGQWGSAAGWLAAQLAVGIGAAWLGHALAPTRIGAAT